jgi:hypothetical protein
VSNVRWVGEKVVRRNIGAYGNDARAAIREGLDYWAPQIETDAKEKAPWTDRSSNARSGLFTWVETGKGVGRLYLSHRMFYGIFLERRWAGRYAIIMPTLQAFEGRVMSFFQRVFRG